MAKTAPRARGLPATSVPLPAPGRDPFTASFGARLLDTQTFLLQVAPECEPYFEPAPANNTSLPTAPTSPTVPAPEQAGFDFFFLVR